jgi:hypothetical protein
MIKLKFTERDTEEYKTWFSFYPTRNKGTGFYLTYENNGYFDPRPQINTNLTTLLALILPFISLWLLPLSLILCFFSWGSLYIHLPYDTGRRTTAESNTYGLMFYHIDSGFPSEFWVRGYRSFNFPWAYTFHKRDVLWDKNKWGDKIAYKTYLYKYKLKSGETQIVNTTIYQEKMYWKRWFGLQIDCKNRIEVEFDSEVGERTGSWKGGTIGCSYEIKKGETAYQCLLRMEQERTFN